MREAEVEDRCDKIAGLYGYTALRFSIRKRSPMPIGTPDRRYQGKYALWFECKRVGGPPSESRLSEAQHAFLTRELDAGALASCGTALELQALLDVLVRDPHRAPALCRKQIASWASKGFRREAA